MSSNQSGRSVNTKRAKPRSSRSPRRAVFVSVRGNVAALIDTI